MLLFLCLILGAGCVKGNSAISKPVLTAQDLLDTQVSPNCLVGVWEIVNKDDFARALIPIGSFESSNLGSIKTHGSAAYRFDEFGVLTVEAASFQADIEVLEENTLAKLVISMDGFASGNFSANSSLITLTDMIRSDMYFSALYDGEEMMSDMRADGYLPLFVAPNNTAEIDCAIDELSISFSGNPNLSQPLRLRKLQ